VRLLLDTHVLLWTLEDPSKLRVAAREAIKDWENQVLVSAASVWELAIKAAAGRLKPPESLESGLENQGFAPLAISVAHALAAGALPRHHGDPFDRMLVAQAQLEGLTIVTRDPDIPRYGVATLTA